MCRCRAGNNRERCAGSEPPAARYRHRESAHNCGAERRRPTPHYGQRSVDRHGSNGVPVSQYAKRPSTCFLTMMALRLTRFRSSLEEVS